MSFKTKAIHILNSLKRKEARTKLTKFFILSYLPLGLSVALLTPDNILNYSWAYAYTSFMASWLPYVAEVGRCTKVPATQFMAAMINLIAMLCSSLMIYVGTKDYLNDTIKWLNGLTITKTIRIFLLIPFCIGGFFFLLFLVPVNQPPSRRDTIMLDSKFGMGFDGSLHIAAGWFLMAAGIMISISFLMLLKRRFSAKRE